MLSSVSNRALAKVAVYGAVFCISSVMYMRYKIEERIRHTDYFRDAMKILRTNPGAVHVLGEPIKEMGFDLSNSEKNFCDGKIAKFQVAVKGSKERGTMFFWAERNTEKWNMQRIELELKNQPDKRLLVKKSETTASS